LTVNQDPVQVPLALNALDPQERARALAQVVAARATSGFPPAQEKVNLHCHTFFSFNGYGYSPSCLAYLSRLEGLAVAGIVDFDVLDGVDEFMAAGMQLNLRTTAGMETRVVVPELADQEINSPGEPGIAYFMGTGFASGAAAGVPLLQRLKQTAQERNRDIIARVNPVLSPVEVDYEADVLPLCPNANPTERHLCIAYADKAEVLYPDMPRRTAFWADKLHLADQAVAKLIDHPPALQGLIRTNMMKSGGPGYVSPDTATFPLLDELVGFCEAAGALPTYAWLDGVRPAEQKPQRLLDFCESKAIAAVNIIPDRNWNISDADTRALKVAKLHEFARLADARGLPIIVGTEMNAYGQRFVDDFAAPELVPLTPLFLKGAFILYGHTVLGPRGMGYLSPWAAGHLPQRHQRNAFYAQLGRLVTPSCLATLEEITPDCVPETVLEAAGRRAGGDCRYAE
jgi:hypothetical protein